MSMSMRMSMSMSMSTSMSTDSDSDKDSFAYLLVVDLEVGDAHGAPHALRGPSCDHGEHVLHHPRHHTKVHWVVPRREAGAHGEGLARARLSRNSWATTTAITHGRMAGMRGARVYFPPPLLPTHTTPAQHSPRQGFLSRHPRLCWPHRGHEQHEGGGVFSVHCSSRKPSPGRTPGWSRCTRPRTSAPGAARCRTHTCGPRPRG